LSAEIAELEKLSLREKAPSLTIKQWNDIAAQIEINKKHDTVLEELQGLNIEDLRTALHEVRTAKSAILQFEKENKDYKSHVSNISQMNDQQIKNWEGTCKRIKDQFDNQMRMYDSQATHFEGLKQAYAEAKANYDQAQETLNSITQQFPENTEATLRNVISQLESARQEWANYEHLSGQYKQALATYNKSIEGVAAEEARLSELSRAREALKVVKAKVQSHLLPSLNKVASMLMSEMTGGEFQSVEVGQDFEVVVDGQPLRTLSGSGKDLANLTLRIGLGRILTHRVLPLMMLDEIDSAMDDTRASFTWQCIQRITPHIGQVLQASHKELDAENRVAV
jgi:DNA repair exonuclease SbcCD ATPase subunit